MNKHNLLLLVSTVLVLLAVTSCSWLVGETSRPNYSQETCIADLNKALKGKLTTEDNLCQPVNFTIKKESALLKVRGEHSHGHFDIRTSKNSLKLFLQAPHIWSDEGTGKILKKLTKRLSPKLSFKNSVHRNQKSMGDKNNSINFDLGKRKDSVLSLLSKVFIKEFPQGSLVQIHGFASNKRKTIKGKHADVIISSGSHKVSKRVLSLAGCLKKNSGNLQVFIFPKEVTELGGTKNVLSRLKSVSGESLFVHLEMSKRYRELVLKNQNIFDQLSSCIEKMDYVK